MVRTLVSGASGFVGRALLARLLDAGETELFGLSRTPPEDALLQRIDWRGIDLRDADAVRRRVDEVRPERVFHLAARAHPMDCERHPTEAFAVQVGGTGNLLAGLEPGTRVLLASTAQVYARGTPSPIPENAPVGPTRVYGLSKLAAEGLAGAASERGVEVVIARAFNHSGRGQSEDYVLPALAASLRRAIEAAEPVRTGNLFPRRDFLHVSDVLSAYEHLVSEGEAGTVYNVCRGEGTSIAEVLEELVRLAGVEVETEIDPGRARPDDPPEIVGDPTRLRSLGWSPQVGVAALLSEVWNAH